MENKSGLICVDRICSSERICRVMPSLNASFNVIRGMGVGVGLVGGVRPLSFPTRNKH